MINKNFYIKIFLFISEFIILDLSGKLAFYLTVSRTFVYQEPFFSFFLIFNLSWMCTSLFLEVYNRRKILDFKTFLQNIIIAITLHVIIMGVYIYGININYITKNLLLNTYLLAFTGITIFRFFTTRIYYLYTSLTYHIRRIVVVGTSDAANELYDFFNAREANVFRFMGFKEDWLNDESKIDIKSVRQKLQELKRFCKAHNIKEIYLSLPLTSQELIDDLAAFTDDSFVHFRIIPDLGVLEQKAVTVDFFGHIPILSLRTEPLKLLINRITKRVFDVFFSSLVILLVFPILFPLIALLIKIESRGPIIFKQKRSGRENKEFTCYKFRTMTQNRQSDSRQASRHDARITRVGSLLRKTSLDEFPQFINVFLGQMSVVGPRPHMLAHTEEYSKIVNKFLYRHFVTPGITGLAQINGFRGGTENPELMRKRIEYDNWYIENWSLALDVKIIFITVWNIIMGEENAY
ncbi:MAG: undecaprenyl-phosphate glucose phosphotransferase [Bacteroidota bacterium]